MSLSNDNSFDEWFNSSSNNSSLENEGSYLYWLVNKVEFLIKNSTYSHDEQDQYLRQLHNYNIVELEEIKSKFVKNQLDPIHEKSDLRPKNYGTKYNYFKVNS